MRLLVSFFKGSAIVIWLIVSFSFGMWGLCEINAFSEAKRLELNERHDTQLENADAIPQFKYKGQTFKTQEALLAYIDLEDSEKGIVQKFLEDIKLVNNNDVSKSVIFILTAVSFGIVGALTDQVKRIVFSKRQRTNALRNGQKVHYTYILEDVSVLYRPLFGGLVGFMALGVTSLIPMLLQTTTEYNVIRPTTLLFFCFFSGLMSDDIYDWLTGIVLDFFRTKTKTAEDIK